MSNNSKNKHYYIYYSKLKNIFQFSNYKPITLNSKIDFSLLEINELYPILIQNLFNEESPFNLYLYVYV